MAKTLYVETNFIMAIAKGQDGDANRLLENVSPPIQLVIPSVCYMEAFSAFARYRNTGNIFLEDLSRQLVEVRRDGIGTLSEKTGDDLDGARIGFDNWINNVRLRLDQTLETLSRVAVMIELDPETIRAALNNRLIDKSSQDNLILHVILNHARSAPGPKALLSGNERDFDQPDAKKAFKQPDLKEALTNAGIKYFPVTKNAIGWLQAQPEP